MGTAGTTLVKIFPVASAVLKNLIRPGVHGRLPGSSNLKTELDGCVGISQMQSRKKRMFWVVEIA